MGSCTRRTSAREHPSTTEQPGTLQQRPCIFQLLEQQQQQQLLKVMGLAELLNNNGAIVIQDLSYKEGANVACLVARVAYGLPTLSS